MFDIASCLILLFPLGRPQIHHPEPEKVEILPSTVPERASPILPIADPSPVYPPFKDIQAPNESALPSSAIVAPVTISHKFELVCLVLMLVIQSYCG